MNAADDLAVLGRVTASLVVVVALALLAARLARRAGRGGGGAGLRVLERTGLSREASVAVVQIGGRGLVVGVTAQNVTLLTELTGDELATARAAAAPPPVTGLPGDEPGATRVVVRSGRPPGVGHVPSRPGTGAVLDPRTWRQALEALRDLTARRR